MSGIHISMNAWNEILARILDDFESQNNVSPDWLINPATKRKLKLDRYYPDAGIAIRFAGLTAKGQKRQDDWQVMEDQQRDQTRVELCKMHDVYLAVLDPIDDPLKQVDKIANSLRRAKKSAEGKRRVLARLEKAMSNASDLRSRIARNPEQMMATLAEGWRDREIRMLNELHSASATNGNGSKRRGRKINVAKLKPGDTIRHERFDQGEILEISGDGDDATITIQFGPGEDGNPVQKTFLVSLVADKIRKL